jgi:hypothetical protein
LFFCDDKNKKDENRLALMEVEILLVAICEANRNQKIKTYSRKMD